MEGVIFSITACNLLFIDKMEYLASFSSSCYRSLLYYFPHLIHISHKALQENLRNISCQQGSTLEFRTQAIPRCLMLGTQIPCPKVVYLKVDRQNHESTSSVPRGQASSRSDLIEVGFVLIRIPGCLIWEGTLPRYSVKAKSIVKRREMKACYLCCNQQYLINPAWFVSDGANKLTYFLDYFCGMAIH